MKKVLPERTKSGLPAIGWCRDCDKVAIDTYDEFGLCVSCRVERKHLSSSPGLVCRQSLTGEGSR